MFNELMVHQIIHILDTDHCPYQDILLLEQIPVNLNIKLILNKPIPLLV